jgi:cytochrome c
MSRITVACAGPVAVASALWLVQPASAADVDADAALALIRSNGCFLCHSVDKNKIGPSFMQTAAKRKGQADAEDAIYRHLTTGPTIRIEGNEEQHRIVRPKDEAAVRNLARWILSR